MPPSSSLRRVRISGVHFPVTELIRLDEDLVLKTSGLKDLVGSSPTGSAIINTKRGSLVFSRHEARGECRNIKHEARDVPIPHLVRSEGTGRADVMKRGYGAMV